MQLQGFVIGEVARFRCKKWVHVFNLFLNPGTGVDPETMPQGPVKPHIMHMVRGAAQQNRVVCR